MPDARTPYFHSDRMAIDRLKAPLSSVIRERGLITQTGKKVNFCGIILQEDEIHVFFPRNTTNQNVLGVPELLSSIIKYDATFRRAYRGPEEGPELMGTDRLSLIYQLLQDYSQNGIYAQRQSSRSVNYGKPDWSRTISRQSAFSHDENIIYPSYESLRRHQSTESEVSKIHSFLIRGLFNDFGSILFGGRRLLNLDFISPFSMNESYMMRVLRSELNKVFSDRDIWLIKSLIDLIERSHGGDSGKDVIGIKNFHAVWEHMLSKIIHGRISLNKDLPIPVYKNKHKELIEFPEKGQRTDLIIADEDKNNICIIDAKYYDANESRGAPGWSDLVKQFFYYKAVKSIYPLAKLKNFFIFPGESNYLTTAHMKRRVDDSLLDAEYGIIKCLYLEPMKVVTAYSRSKKIIDISEHLLMSE